MILDVCVKKVWKLEQRAGGLLRIRTIFAPFGNRDDEKAGDPARCCRWLIKDRGTGRGRRSSSAQQIHPRIEKDLCRVRLARAARVR
jgi:hypothetical protein